MYDPDFILPPVDAKGEFRLSSALLGIEEGVTLRFDAKQAISHLLGVRKHHLKKGNEALTENERKEKPHSYLEFGHPYRGSLFFRFRGLRHVELCGCRRQ